MAEGVDPRIGVELEMQHNFTLDQMEEGLMCYGRGNPAQEVAITQSQHPCICEACGCVGHQAKTCPVKSDPNRRCLACGQPWHPPVTHTFLSMMSPIVHQEMSKESEVRVEAPAKGKGPKTEREAERFPEKEKRAQGKKGREKATKEKRSGNTQTGKEHTMPPSVRRVLQKPHIVQITQDETKTEVPRTRLVIQKPNRAAEQSGSSEETGKQQKQTKQQPKQTEGKTIIIVRKGETGKPTTEKTPLPPPAAASAPLPPAPAPEPTTSVPAVAAATPTQAAAAAAGGQKKETRKQKTLGTQEKGGRRGRAKKDHIYPEYWAPEVIEEALEKGEVVKGIIHGNPNNMQVSYVTVEGFGRDLKVTDRIARNRTYDGDEVVIEIYQVDKWHKGDPKTETKDKDADKKETKGDEDKKESDEDEKNAEKKKKESEDKPKLSKTELVAKARELTQDSEMIATGHVVGVTQRTEKTEHAGVLMVTEQPHSTNKTYHFVPINKRVPRGFVSPSDDTLQYYLRQLKAQQGMQQKRNKRTERKNEKACHMVGGKKLFFGRYKEWTAERWDPPVELLEIIGSTDDVEANTAAILMENNVSDKPFSASVESELPKLPWMIPEKEIALRFDFREKQIFTIDPITARDLDDALSCQELPDGTFEVGVHIADVSYFVEPGTELDRVASWRATSVYLTQRVVPMLPRVLCEELCSLNPGQDRLAFSVMWRMDKNGTILSERMGRSIIRSCCKLNYDLAYAALQGKLDGERDGWRNGWGCADATICPPAAQVQAPHTTASVVEAMKNLNMLAKVLHKERTDHGSIKICVPRLTVSLDKDQNPIAAFLYETTDSNHLVEEWMLLANRRVATRLTHFFPETALLRFHPPPNEKKLGLVNEFLKKNGLGELDTRGSREMAESLDTIIRNHRDTVPYLDMLLPQLFMRSMQLAQYFCTGTVEQSKWRHWALAFDYYTHFTSPIRRYPDVIVHRQLALSLEIEKAKKQAERGRPLTPQAQALLGNVQYDEKTVTRFCAESNEKKRAARICSDYSARFFQCLLLQKHEEITDGLVYEMDNKYIDVFVPQYALLYRIERGRIGGGKRAVFDRDTRTLTITWGKNAKPEQDEPSEEALEEDFEDDIYCEEEEEDFQDDEELADEAGQKQVIRIFDVVPVKIGVKKDSFPLEQEVSFVDPTEVQTNTLRWVPSTQRTLMNDVVE